MNSFSQKENLSKEMDNPFRVMVVDDSAIIRGFICRYLQEDSSIEVVTTANNGEVALNELKRKDIEVVVLDIEMPVMDGLTALPKMIEHDRNLQVVMASTLTLANAEISLESLDKGAVDYVPKPETTRGVNASIDFRREIVEKVKAWGGRRRRRLGLPLPSSPSGKIERGTRFVRPTATRRSPGLASSSTFTKTERQRPLISRPSIRNVEPKQTSVLSRDKPTAAREIIDRTKPISLKKGSGKKCDVLAIGSSTGGPQALIKLFKSLEGKVNVPIVLVQHMPKTFTEILAKHITSATSFMAKEGADGDVMEPGHIYVAPGDHHMVCELTAEGKVVIRINSDPPENYCRPAVDPLFRSLIPIYGDRALAVILTGMGHDGLKGARDLVRQGATLLAQDEETSVVWGMPGAVASAGLCSRVEPIDEIGKTTVQFLAGGVR